MKPVQKTLSTAIMAALLPAGLLAMASGSAVAQEGDQADSDMMLEEVVVTARKVEENLQEVPVATRAGHDSQPRRGSVSPTARVGLCASGGRTR